MTVISTIIHHVPRVMPVLSAMNHQPSGMKPCAITGNLATVIKQTASTDTWRLLKNEIE